MPARAHLDRRAGELGGDFELVDIVRHGCGRGEKDGRRRAYQHRRLERSAHLFRLLVVERQVMARRETAAQFLVAEVHRAVEREIGHAGLRLLGDKHREIRRAVALAVGQQRQVAEPTFGKVRRRRYLSLQRPSDRAAQTC